MIFHHLLTLVLTLTLAAGIAAPALADTSPADSYMWFEYKLATAKSKDDLDKIRGYVTSDAGDAFDKIIQQTTDGTLDVQPLTFTRMVFETTKYPPKIVNSKLDGDTATIEISGTSPITSVWTREGAPINAVVYMTRDGDSWKVSNVKSASGGIPVWNWFGIDTKK